MGRNLAQFLLGKRKRSSSRSARGHASAYECSLGGVAVRAILTRLRNTGQPQRLPRLHFVKA
jgi:hypothetical protein